MGRCWLLVLLLVSRSGDAMALLRIVVAAARCCRLDDGTKADAVEAVKTERTRCNFMLLIDFDEAFRVDEVLQILIFVCEHDGFHHQAEGDRVHDCLMAQLVADAITKE
jgi:hypothetical protein